MGEFYSTFAAMHRWRSAGVNVVFVSASAGGRGKVIGTKKKKIEKFAERQSLGVHQAAPGSASTLSPAVLITLCWCLCPAGWKYPFTHRLSKLIL